MHKTLFEKNTDGNPMSNVMELSINTPKPLSEKFNLSRKMVQGQNTCFQFVAQTSL